MPLSIDQLAQMTQREFGRAGERFNGVDQRLDQVEQRLDRVERRLDVLDATVKNGFADLSSRFETLNDNLSKTLMVWDRRFTDHRISVDTKLRTFEKALASK